MTANLLAHFGLAFTMTQVIECPIYLRALRGRRHALLIAFGASAWTHPIVAFVMPALWAIFFAPVFYAPHRTTIDLPFLFRAAGFFVLAEGFAILGEAMWLKLLRVPRPLFWSVIANITSSTIGALLTLTTGWP